MKKRIISASLAAALLLSTAVVSGASVNAQAAEQDYGLAEHTADGVILHCYDWSFNAIRENLPEIAAAGYTTVQTSPVQQPKDYGEWLNGEGQWWKLYQPLSFTVATENSWIGTKDELTALCEEADKYGIKIICDIVSNHMANQTGNVYLTYSHDIKKYEPELFKNSSTYFHQLRKGVDDGNLQWLVQGELDYLPDLNTGDPFVQERVISLLKECIDCGVDGFRFDAAKHIETPADGEWASDFWPNVVGAANSYAEEKGSELFIYGEMLNSAGKGRSTLDYTKYINLTDNKAGDITLYNVAKKQPDKVLIGQQYTYKDDDPSNFVLWAESHDTYMGKSGSGGFSNTASVSNEDIAKAWAIIAARAKSHSLYFARPNELMGLAGDTAWKSTVVSEVNKFHNKFIGTDDEIFADGDIIAVQRGDNGIVLVNLGDSADVSIAASLKDGEYTDAITGNTFTAADGTVSGTIGESGVAVIYKDAKITPKVYFSQEDTTFRRDTFPVVLTLENAEKGTYSINDGEAVEFEGEAKVDVGAAVSAGESVTLTATAINGDTEISETHVYTKEDFAHSGVYVYYDNSETNYNTVFAYGYYEYFDDKGRKITAAKDGQWPGTKMEYDEETGLYVYEVPADIPVGTGSVILTNSNISKKWETDGMTIPAEVSIYDATQKKLVDPNGVTLMYGDTNGDNLITSSDALDILRNSAGLSVFTDAQNAQADVDGDKAVTSGDALLVLRHSVGLIDTNGLTGTLFTFGGSSGNTQPDNPPAPSGNTFYALNSAGWIFDYGCKLWIVNNDTNEALEMTKSDPSSDKAPYAYVDLPSGWTNISLHRTQWNMTVEESKEDSSYAVWQCGTIPEGKNAYSITDNNKGKFRSYPK